MLGIIIVFAVLIFFAVHMLQGDLSAYKDRWETFVETATPAQLKRTVPSVRRAQMESAFGTPWVPWSPEASPEADFDRPAARVDYLQSYFGPMDMEVAGDQVLIYDMQLGHTVSLDNLPSILQTVISIKPPELRLPPFVLRPKCFFPDAFLRGELILTDTELDAQYTLATHAPHRAKALFQSELGSKVLIPFLKDHQWTIQWTGKFLIVYEFNRLIDPERLAEAALEVSEFFELLKSGPTAIDQGISNLIKETTQRTNGGIGLGRR